VLSGSRFSPDRTHRSWLRLPYTAPPETLDKAATLLHEAVSEPMRHIDGWPSGSSWA
jgi:hypothetical protein